MSLKKIVLLIVGASLSSGAYAADLGSTKETQYFDAPVSSTWSGVYVGAHAGYGMNSHELNETSNVVVPGTPESCLAGTTLKDGKCYSTVGVPAIGESCKDGATLKDGKCYAVVAVPAVPESCKDGAVLKAGQCYVQVFNPWAPEYASCANGTGNIASDGKCYTHVEGTNATEYSCTRGYTYGTITVGNQSTTGCYTVDPNNANNYELSPFNGQAYMIKPGDNIVVGSGPIASNWRLPPDTLVVAIPATTKEVEKSETHVAAVPASETQVEEPGAYTASVDATSTVKNILFGLDPDGFLGGVRVGLDFQPNNSRFVIGLFGDYNFASNAASVEHGKLTDENSYLLAIRAGALINDKTLFYILGGYGSQDVAYGDDLEKTFNHMVAGAGIEYKMTDSLTLGLEAQHWFEEEQVIFEDASYKLTDTRSDTRVLARVNYRLNLK